MQWFARHLQFAYRGFFYAKKRPQFFLRHPPLLSEFLNSIHGTPLPFFDICTEHSPIVSQLEIKCKRIFKSTKNGIDSILTRYYNDAVILLGGAKMNYMGLVFSYMIPGIILGMAVLGAMVEYANEKKEIESKTQKELARKRQINSQRKLQLFTLSD